MKKFTNIRFPLINRILHSASVVAVVATFGSNSVHSATGIYGGYLMINDIKYKSSSSYGGSETALSAVSSLGTFDKRVSGSGGLLKLSSAETFTYQNNTHSTFGGALAYRVRLSTEAKSTNPGDYTFLGMGDGDGTGLNNNDEKFVWSGNVNLLNLITTTPATTTTYNFDFVHKVGAWEGGSNFERLANLNNSNPGTTSWGSIDAFTVQATVVPEPSTGMLMGLGFAGLVTIRLFRKKS
jgi:PEP-CTERM motif